MRRLSTVLLLLMTSINSFAADAETPRPAGLPACPPGTLSDVEELITNERFPEALEALFDFTPNGLMEVAWTRYLKGLAMFGEENYEAGLDEFNAVVAHTDAIDRSEEYRDAFRLTGLCLKKLGWYERKNERYDAAIERHKARYDLVERYGSYKEMHDAAVSLDVDYYFKGDAKQSEEWIRREIVIGEKIVDEHERDRALGVSWNNLGATLTEKKDFEGALEAAQNSARYWIAWEKAEGHTKEFRAVWSFFGVGEVYRSWAEALEKKPKEAAQKRELAREQYEQAFALAKELKMPAEDLSYIEEALGKVQE